MTTYQPCAVFADIISVWVYYAGDGKTWRDMVDHRKTCATCQNNANLFKAWRDARKEEPKPKRETQIND